ncbi:DUF58 domain-containing protein [Nitrospina watsonii]|uniref:DUF58 domain-containing protein n=1 Tax=Nitrospina watsonii TaxID=1323948 RepID=A0ABN8VXR5_9BACT|nr:DUF58 domain-containing protein [Nitrospina watsonii]CAI2718522.1 DUF58 domain-containing protein [Nitrospina watsonii]
MNPPNEYKPVFTVSFYNRTLHLTREGGGFIFLVFGVGLGAINTGNNLLYLILAMCCSFIAVSGILSEHTLRNIRIRASLPKTIYPGDAYPIQIQVHNDKKRSSSYSCYVEFPPDSQGRYRVEPALYFFQIPARTTVEKTALLTARKRGRLRIRYAQLRTRFPFGFFIKTRLVPVDVETLVFPVIKDVELPDPTDIAEEGEGVISQRGDDLFALREFRPGDTLSAVHWKSSAKTGNLRVKEFAHGGFHSFTLFLNVINPETQRMVASDILERRISETASLAYHLMRRGDEVRLKTHDHESPSANSEAHLESILTYLALVTPDFRTKTTENNG